MTADLNAIAEFIWLEADLLDQKDYVAWLDLWDKDGTYIVPIDRDGDGDDYQNRLNYAYDNAAMRDMRVRRLTSGESVSASSAAVTVRTASRFRRLEDAPTDMVRVRCAQHLTVFRHGTMQLYASDVTYTLRTATDGNFRLFEKIILFSNSDDALAGFTFLP